MNVCIIGVGLTSLSLAKILINKKINVHNYQKKIDEVKSSRTIGISKKNLEFIEKEIYKFSKKDIWKIKKIEIFNEKLKNKRILNFENNGDNLFYMIKNDKFFKSLNEKLSKSKFFKKIIIKNEKFYENLIKEKKYDLIINCDSGNYISKKYFFRKIDKDYNNLAYTTILKHEKIDNNSAIQTFTKFGPIAFLPISECETSVVCSLDTEKKKYSEKQVYDLININNPKFKIKKFLKLDCFNLNSSILRNYYYKNILAFGDLLHKVHPLTGQGFNMTVRDLKTISKIIKNKIDLGLQLDSTIFEEFEQETKHLNFTFSSGIDFIYEFFNFDKKNKDKKLNKILNYIGKNKKLNNTIIKLANNGLNI